MTTTCSSSTWTPRSGYASSDCKRTLGTNSRELALSSRTPMNWEGQLGVGYDPFAKPTMNDRNLRDPAVRRNVFGSLAARC